LGRPFRFEIPHLPIGEAFSSFRQKPSRNSKHAMNTTKHDATATAPRRGFLVKLTAALFGGMAVSIPVASGLMAFLDPLRKRPGRGEFVLITSLSALPADGSPRSFAVRADRIDAWSKESQVAIGTVYLRRLGIQSVQAFSSICPHAGCLVQFSAESKAFNCPCHNSRFALDGQIANPKSPSPRGLDELEVQVRNGADIWVRYKKFRTGVDRKITVA
jgi:menaquinol-cytochrome c reductase iron-sulfur subunit